MCTPEWGLDAVLVLLAKTSQRPAGSVPVIRAGLSTGCCFASAQLQAVPAPRFAADRHTLHSHHPVQTSAQRFHLVSDTAACVMCHGIVAMGLTLSICSGLDKEHEWLLQAMGKTTACQMPCLLRQSRDTSP